MGCFGAISPPADGDRRVVKAVVEFARLTGTSAPNLKVLENGRAL